MSTFDKSDQFKSALQTAIFNNCHMTTISQNNLQFEFDFPLLTLLNFLAQILSVITFIIFLIFHSRIDRSDLEWVEIDAKVPQLTVIFEFISL